MGVVFVDVDGRRDVDVGELVRETLEGLAPSLERCLLLVLHNHPIP